MLEKLGSLLLIYITACLAYSLTGENPSSLRRNATAPLAGASNSNIYLNVPGFTSLRGTNSVTISGISSGGYFAVQFHIAHSTMVSGVGVFAGGPYYCAKSSLTIAEMQCMKYLYGGPSVHELVSMTQDWSVLGYVDPVADLRDDKIYIFSGDEDTVIDQKVVKALEEYYLSFVPRANIKSDYDLDAEHCIPTLSYGEACTTLSSPYIGNCKFDGAGKALNQLYGSLNPAGTAYAKNLFVIDQTPYITRDHSSIGSIGYIYIPTACQSGSTACKLHVSFHGCEQNLALIGNEYAANAGFNEWAETNNLVVLYPYVQASHVPYNPNGCWDWWAYSGDDYGWKSGAQIDFVYKLINSLL